MNKYQESVLKLINFGLSTSNNEKGSVRLVDNILELTQNENYNLQEYNLKIFNCKLSKIELDDKFAGIDEVKVDFKNKSKFITLYFADDIVEPIKLNLVYIEANKKDYDTKISTLKAEECIEKASIKCSTGPSLVNIYFQPCDDICSYTRIKLYTAKGRFEPLHGCVIPVGWKPRLIGGEIEQMIGNYKVEEGSLFKSITGLANGVYGYMVSQYDKDDHLLFETKPDYFVIR